MLTEDRSDPAQSSETLRIGFQSRTPATITLAIDDFGLHAGIRTATLSLLEMGRVQAIGCMVGGPDWPEGARSLRHIDRTQADLGLHLDFTEWPCLPASRQRLVPLVVRSLIGAVDQSMVLKEIRSQLAAFEQALGRPPDYVDGHQHVHQLPIIRDVLVGELIARYGAHRPWLRSTRPPKETLTLIQPGLIGRLAPFKSNLIHSLGARGLDRLMSRHHLAHNTRLLGVYGFDGDKARYAALLAHWLGQAHTGDLLMCHPSCGPAGTVEPIDPIGPARRAEFEVLSGSIFAQLSLSANVQFRPMSALLAR